MDSQKIVFGAGALGQLPHFLSPYGWRRLLLVTSGAAQRSGRAGQVAALMGQALAATLGGAQPHVPEAQVQAALRLANEHAVDAVLALGGGSAIGLAKATVYLLNRLRADPGVDAGGATAPRLAAVAAIPTTYAGSEMTPVFGITVQPEGATAAQKITTRDPQVLPRLVLYDPELTVDLPPDLTAATGINALAHCVEAVYAVNRNAISTQAALAGARLISHALPRCVAAGDDLDARTEMLEGAHLAGKALSDVSMGLHHGVCHVLGGSAGVPHGVANAILLPHAMRYNLDAVTPHLAALAEAMGLPGATDAALARAAVRHVAALIAELGLPQRLRDAGVPAESLPYLARLAAESKTVKQNPKPVSVEEAEQMLREAW